MGRSLLVLALCIGSALATDFDRIVAGAQAKAAVIAAYPLTSGASLLVACIHGINRASQAAFERQLAAVAAVLEGHTGPVLWAGDFNAQSAGKLAWGMERSDW